MGHQCLEMPPIQHSDKVMAASWQETVGCPTFFSLMDFSWLLQ